MVSAHHNGGLSENDLVGRIRRSLSKPAGMALRVGETELSWVELAQLTDKLVETFARAGVVPGASVAIPSRNDLFSAATLLAVLQSGACAILVGPAGSPDATLNLLRTPGPDAILLPENDPVIGLTRHEDPTLVVTYDGNLRSTDGATIRCGVSRTRSGIVISTSGTTGEPKPFELSLPLLSRAILEIEAINTGFGDALNADRNWPALIQYSPMAHIGGVLTFLRAIAQGRPTIMLGKFDPETWSRTVAEFRLRTTGLPPSMLRMVLEASIDPARLASLVSVWSGTAPLREEDRQAFTEKYGIPVLGNYGATEFCGAIAAWSLDDHRKWHASRASAVGRINPSVAQARVRSPDGETLLAYGATGVLEFKVHRIGDHWIETSDLGSVDDMGFLTLCGRKDEAIIRGGFKLAPTTISNALRKHPYVRDAAVVGKADHRLGQVPVAAVELTEKDKVGTHELREFVRAQLPAYFVPIEIRAVDALPRNAAMKLDRRAIAALFDEPK